MTNGSLVLNFTFSRSPERPATETEAVIGSMQQNDLFELDRDSDVEVLQAKRKGGQGKCSRAPPAAKMPAKRKAASLASTQDTAPEAGSAPALVEAVTQEPAKIEHDVTKANENTENKTQWTHVTRTMLWRCIQKHDPFNAKAKGDQWDLIAESMIKATQNMKNEPDGDLSVYGNGRSVQMFYKRCSENLKRASAGEKHSGVAGKSDNPAKQEENNQLSACIELERSAKEIQDTKREVNHVYDKLSKGEVNDFIVDTAIKNEKTRPKLAKVLASRLREAKMRKMAFESTNKGGTYTYSATDLENFAHWAKLKSADPDLRDDSEIETSSAPRGGGLAAAINSMCERLPSVQALTPMSPVAFAEAFFNAKRASIPSLKEKLAAVDADAAEGLLNAEEVTFYKKRIKEAHYAQISQS
jgi:hypothetical protein